MFRHKVWGTNVKERLLLVQKERVESYAWKEIGEGCGEPLMRKLSIDRISWDLFAMAMPYRGLHRWEQGVKDDGDNDENFKYDKQVDVYLQY